MFADLNKHVVIMGAGPAGLTAAYQLIAAGIASTSPDVPRSGIFLFRK
jgi:uncharacterized protein with NAD-binding domain and iron-sulfur cluster